MHDARAFLFEVLLFFRFFFFNFFFFKSTAAMAGMQTE